MSDKKLEPATCVKSVSDSGGPWWPLREIVLSLPHCGSAELALRHDLTARPPSRAGSKVPARERRRGLAAVGRMIAACRHGGRAATGYEIAW